MSRSLFDPFISVLRRSKGSNPPPVRITSMRLGDLGGIIAIEEESFPVPWSRQAFLQELTTNPYARYLVARRGSQVLGYGGMWLIIDEAHITNIAVRARERGRGTGNLILSHLLKMTDAQGCRRVTLEVRRSNLVAQHLYLKHGFEVRSVRRGYYTDNHEDALLMVRET